MRYPRALGLRIAVHERPELWAMVGVNQVGHLVHDHLVEHPEGSADQLVGEADGAIARRARTPSLSLIRYTANRVGDRKLSLFRECLGANQQGYPVTSRRDESA